MNIFIDLSVKIWYILFYIGSRLYSYEQNFLYYKKGEAMAKDILDAIRTAEDEARAREAEAKTAAQESAAQAKKAAAALVAEREKKAAQKAEDELKNAQAQGEQELEKARQSAHEQCGNISALADKNRENVIKNAANAILK